LKFEPFAESGSSVKRLVVKNVTSLLNLVAVVRLVRFLPRGRGGRNLEEKNDCMVKRNFDVNHVVRCSASRRVLEKRNVGESA
jgi:hypothetical protein